MDKEMPDHELEALKMEFFQELKEKFEGFKYDVVVEHGVALVVVWNGNIFKAENPGKITLAMDAMKEKYNLLSVFSGGYGAVPRKLFQSGKLIALFSLAPDKKVVTEKSRNWSVEDVSNPESSASAQRILMIHHHVLDLQISAQKLFKEYSEMISYGRHLLGGKAEVSLTGGWTNSDTMNIQLIKRKEEQE